MIIFVRNVNNANNDFSVVHFRSNLWGTELVILFRRCYKSMQTIDVYVNIVYNMYIWICNNESLNLWYYVFIIMYAMNMCICNFIDVKTLHVWAFMIAIKLSNVNWSVVVFQNKFNWINLYSLLVFDKHFWHWIQH